MPLSTVHCKPHTTTWAAEAAFTMTTPFPRPTPIQVTHINTGTARPLRIEGEGFECHRQNARERAGARDRAGPGR